MKKIKFIQVAACLGITVPACLLGIAEKCEASEVRNYSRTSTVINREEANPVQSRILGLFSAEEQTPPREIVHGNVHADFTVPHTNVHANFRVDGKHTDQHSNTPAKHTNQHSNYR